MHGMEMEEAKVVSQIASFWLWHSLGDFSLLSLSLIFHTHTNTHIVEGRERESWKQVARRSSRPPIPLLSLPSQPQPSPQLLSLSLSLNWASSLFCQSQLHTPQLAQNCCSCCMLAHLQSLSVCTCVCVQREREREKMELDGEMKMMHMEIAADECMGLSAACCSSSGSNSSQLLCFASHVCVCEAGWLVQS